MSALPLPAYLCTQQQVHEGSDSVNDALNRLADEYMAVAARINVEQYEVPSNTDAEAALVQEAYRSGTRHDPQFTFKPVPQDAIDDLANFRTKLNEVDSPWLAPLV